MGIKVWLYYVVCLCPDRNSWLHNVVHRHNFQRPVDILFPKSQWGRAQAPDGVWTTSSKGLGSHGTYPVRSLQAIYLMACGVGFGVVFLGKHGNPKWNTQMGAPSSNSKRRDILKSVLISSSDGSILIGFIGQHLAFALSKNPISIGSFHLHDQVVPATTTLKDYLEVTEFSQKVGDSDLFLSVFQKLLFQTYVLGTLVCPKCLGFARIGSEFFRPNR